MILAVSVDLDETRHYEAIHGSATESQMDVVHRLAVPRLSDWARQRGIPLTWFVVGNDLENRRNAGQLRRLAAAGDEIGCHSYSHPYDLTRLSVKDMRREVEQGREVIARAVGTSVTGFRAPGYVVSDGLLDLLGELGFAYDASVFPCPAYYALKVGAIGAMRARGRRSKSMIDVPGVLRAPTAPYQVGHPYWSRGSGLWEIPIQVTRGARLPFIGSALTLAGPVGARMLAGGVSGSRFVNLELHGIDALDEHDDLGRLAKHQRDLRIPWPRKLEAIDAAISRLQAAGYRCVRMDELAAHARRHG